MPPQPSARGDESSPFPLISRMLGSTSLAVSLGSTPGQYTPPCGCGSGPKSLLVGRCSGILPRVERGFLTRVFKRRALGLETKLGPHQHPDQGACLDGAIDLEEHRPVEVDRTLSLPPGRWVSQIRLRWSAPGRRAGPRPAAPPPQSRSCPCRRYRRCPWRPGRGWGGVGGGGRSERQRGVWAGGTPAS